MGREFPPLPVKLFIGVLYRDREDFEGVKEALVSEFGVIDYESKEIDFKWTNYYEEELGSDLKRVFISFFPLISPDQIADIKRITNRIEGDKRRINLDPGYIEGGKVVLATTKDQAHRIYLSKGIYAEVTLRFRDGRFIPFDYTYPDYRSEEYHVIFSEIRKIYFEDVKERFPPTDKLTTKWVLKNLMDGIDKRKALLFLSKNIDIIELIGVLHKAKKMCDVLTVGVKGKREEAEALSHVDIIDYVFTFKGDLDENACFLKPDILFLAGDMDLREIQGYEGRVVRL